jgi:tetratricopeptide (TPR) repeat protein
MRDKKLAALLLFLVTTINGALAADKSQKAPTSALAHNLAAADHLCSARKFNDCIALTTRILQDNQDCEAAYLLRGHSNYRMERFRAAINDFTNYFKRTKGVGNLLAHRLRGLSYCQFDQLQEALEDFNTCIKSSPETWDYYQDRSKLYCSLKQFDKAIADASLMVKLKPDSSRYSMRARIYYMANDYQNSANDWNRAIGLSPQIASFYASRAQCYDKLGRKELADADRKKLGELVGTEDSSK